MPPHPTTLAEVLGRLEEEEEEDVEEDTEREMKEGNG